MNKLFSTLRKKSSQSILSLVLLFFAVNAGSQTAWVPVGSSTGIASDGQATDITLFATGVGNGNPDTLYVAYKDFANSNGVTVLMFNGTSWSPVGSKPVVSNVNFPRLAIDLNGGLAIAYANQGNANRLNVKQFSSGSWSTVGTADFWPATTGAGVSNLALITKTYSSSDPYYLGFTDGNNANAVTFVHYPGAWTQFGSTQPGGKAVSLTQNGVTGDIYTLFVDNSDVGQAKEFQTTDWTPMGGGSISASSCSNPVIRTNGYVTYAAFTDYGHGLSIASTKYDAVASDWSTPSPDTFSLEAAYISMVLEGSKTNAIPLASFQEDPGGSGANSGKLRVVHFKNNYWQDVASTQSFVSDGRATYTSVAINKAGDYFVAYSDATQGGKLVVKKFGNPLAVPTVPASNISLQVYPNPSTGSFTISGDKGSYVLMNVLGQEIQNFELNNNGRYTVSGLTPGLYLVKGSNGFISQKIVVTK
jgi:hypothetical protein